MAKVVKLEISNGTKTFKALVNPDTISHNLAINYTGDEDIPAGTMKPDAKFTKYENDKLSFKLLIDSSGAIEPGDDAAKQIKTLKEVAYNYSSSKHEPHPVKISWGDFLQFEGRLESMAINYTLFSADAKPIRATVDLNFVEDTTPAKDTNMRNTNSPDLSHLVKVKVGDTLPEMCEKIYGNSKMYLQIAKINNLINFRNLVPGTEILFPPISQE